MAEKWAEKCAKLERGASGFIFEATQEYAAKSQEGWSLSAIAAEVTAAGFSINKSTVQRRLQALAQVEGHPGPGQEVAFAEAYTTENTRGDENRRRGLPSNEEGVAMVLEQAAKTLQDKYDWTEAEVKQEIAEAKPRGERVAKEKAKAPTDYDHAVAALEEVRAISDRPSSRTLTKLQEIALEIDVRAGAEV
jgi:hypothetical protein